MLDSRDHITGGNTHRNLPRDAAPSSSSPTPTPDSRPPLSPRDPALNSLVCALLDPYTPIEEIARERDLTVIQLAEKLAEAQVSLALDTLRKVFTLRAEMLALHARAAAVGRLSRIATNGDDDETARRAATTLLRMFRPDGSPAPAPPPRDDRTRSSRDDSTSPTRQRGVEHATTNDSMMRNSAPNSLNGAANTLNGAATVKERPLSHADLNAPEPADTKTHIPDSRFPASHGAATVKERPLSHADLRAPEPADTAAHARDSRFPASQLDPASQQLSHVSHCSTPARPSPQHADSG